MPAKKIDTKEKKIQEKRQSVKIKLAFAAGIAVLVMGVNAYMNYARKDIDAVVAQMEQEQDKNDETESVLGITEEERARFTQVREQSQLLADQVTEQSTELLEESKDRLDNTVSEIVYNTTIKPLIDRIKGLPGDQQEYIKEAICVPLEE